MFKLKPNNEGTLLNLIYVLGTKVELLAIAKELSKLTENPHHFAKKFNIVIQIYELVFPDLYQF